MVELQGVRKPRQHDTLTNAARDDAGQHEPLLEQNFETARDHGDRRESI